MANTRNVVIYQSKFVKVYFICGTGMMINLQILEMSFSVCLCHDHPVL